VLEAEDRNQSLRFHNTVLIHLFSMNVKTSVLYHLSPLCPEYNSLIEIFLYKTNLKFTAVITFLPVLFAEPCASGLMLHRIFDSGLFNVPGPNKN
jgi:hypothetical protein